MSVSGVELLTLAQLAEALQVDRATTYRWLRSGVLPIPLLHMGGVTRVRAIDVENHLAELARQSVEDQAQLRPVEVRRAAARRKAS